MPAFDPVRDAVLNSPLVPTPPARMHIDLPAPPHSHQDYTNTPSSAASSHAPSTQSESTLSGVSTPVGRRATDLSVLLNSDPPGSDTPLFTPTTPRAPAGFSHLLLPTERAGSEDREQLTNSVPLRRRSSGNTSSATSSSHESSYFAWPSSSSTSATMSARASASVTSSPLASASLALPGGLPTPQGTNTPPVVRSPVVPTLSNLMMPTDIPYSSRPSSSHSSRPSTAIAVPVSVLSGPGPPPVQRGGSANGAYRSPNMPPPPAPPSPSVVASRPTGSASAPQNQPQTPGEWSGPDPAPMPPPRQHVPTPSPPPRQRATPNPQPSPSSAPMSTTMPQNRRSSLETTSRPPSRSQPGGNTSINVKMESANADASPDTSNLFGKRSTTPYAPKNRRTPAHSVLTPLSPAEMERYRNYPGGVGTMLLRKRKREREMQRRPKRESSVGANGDVRDEDDERPVVKRRKVGDVGLVVEHYNARPDVGVSQRQESPIIGLKSFNNWVKSVLITRFAHPALVESPASPMEAEPMRGRGAGGGTGMLRGRVLDMGCGKGGDLTKWSKAKVREYVGVDIAAISVDQARLRHAQTRSGPRFAASFFPLDCYANRLRDGLPPGLLVRPFDVVSMQFCMHYAFESEEKARCMLDNVSAHLRSGGRFIGTIPNATQLLGHLDALPKDASELTFGNSVYKIRFETREQRPLFGFRYWFYLQDAVDDVPEYVVQWDNFVKLAAEYGLKLVYKEEFHQIFEEHHEHDEFGPLLQRMRVVDANGESHMDEDQWEAANIYVGFAFEKH